MVRVTKKPSCLEVIQINSSSIANSGRAVVQLKWGQMNPKLEKCVDWLGDLRDKCSPTQNGNLKPIAKINQKGNVLWY